MSLAPTVEVASIISGGHVVANHPRMHSRNYVSPSDIPPIGATESLYRKISVASGWYDPATRHMAYDAMKPLEYDTTGLSLTARRSVARGVGQRTKPEGYFLAVLLVSEIRQQGMTVVPVPIFVNAQTGDEENLRTPRSQS